MFKWVIELKFFGRAISNDDNVENEIEVQQKAVQLTAGAGQKLEGNPNSNCYERVHKSKIKSFRKFASIVTQWVKFQ